MENPVKELRARLGLSQHQFATLLGCSYSSVQNYEAGRKVPSPVVEQLRSIASREGHADLARALASDKREVPDRDLAAQRKRLHGILDDVLNSGDPDVVQSLLPHLEFCAKWLRRGRH